MTSRRRLFLVMYMASGAAALVYEVSWTRLLTLQFGHTVAAASTVLAAFMGGLAVGAWLAGRFGDRVDAAAHPQALRLRLYAALELLVAVVAVLLPFGLAACAPALAWAYADGAAPLRFGIVRVVLSLVLLGVPAAAMGATFPLAAAWFWGRERFAVPARSAHTISTASTSQQLQTAPDPNAAADAGVLYAANTAGAAIGAILAGFWLIPAVGLQGTTAIGVALNACAAGGALWLARRSAAGTPAPALSGQSSTPTQPSRKRHAPRSARPLPAPFVPQPSIASVVAALSGFTALVYEVAWTRLLALVIGPTTYAFATMAAAFISGLAIGSAAGSRLARRSARPGVWLAITLFVCAIAAASAGWFAASRLPLMVAAEVTASGALFGRVLLQQALGITLLLLPMTVALGAAFPLALALGSGGAAAIGRDAAHVYAANTLGAIGGALAGGFLLIPALGLRWTFLWTAVLGAAGGAICLALVLNTSRPNRRVRTGALSAACAAAVLAVLAALPSWDHQLLASGAYKYAPYLQARDLDTVLRAGRLEYYKEGAAATVSVRSLGGTRSLAIDGKVDASNAGDMLTQRLLGLLPVLLHDKPQDICVIGLGSGVTLGSALATGDVRRADVVEISPEVVEASAFFNEENGNALQAPGVRLIVGDGRSHLLLTSRRYDVIVSEPSNPWMAGVAALFTREFFEAARARLEPDGLLCQWAHTYDISSSDLRSIVRTFASVFPQGTMWLVGEGDLLLIGTNGDAILPHLNLLEARWRRGAAPAALSGVGIAGRATPFALFSLLAGGPRELQQYSSGAAIQTDDRMALEFSAPRGIYGRMMNENGAAIGALRPSPLPPPVDAAFRAATDEAWTTRGRMELKAEAFGAAYDALHRAVAMNGRNVDALNGLSRAAAGARRQDEERTWLASLAAADPANAPVRIELSHLLAAAGDFVAAERAASDALRVAPDDPRAAEQLASVFADAGDAAQLEPLAAALVERFPARPDSRYYLATALFLKRRTKEAAAEARRLVAAHPDHARGFNLLGAACATDGDADCARAAFTASIRLNPRDASTYVNLGLFLLQSGDPDGAVREFAEALSIDPGSTAARDGLSQAHEARASKRQDSDPDD